MYDCPHQVGEEVTVSGAVSVTNSSGGTTLLRNGPVACRVTRAFFDDETGWCFSGTPIDPAVLAEVRRIGTTGFDADWYRANRPDDTAGAARATRAAAEFDPSRLSFSEFDVVPSPERVP